MTRKTKDPQHAELTAVLEGMLERNDDITARAVTRLHKTIRNASDITRHDERRTILERFQSRQVELRKFAGKVRNTGTAVAARNLQAANERIQELEANERARAQSHVQMIRAIGELGGTAKLLKFYKRYADIRDKLARQDALPPELYGEPAPTPNTVPSVKLKPKK